MTDLEIINKIKSWNTEIYSDLYDKYVDKIYNFVYLKTFSVSDSEDITSEVFFNAYDKIDSFKEKSWATFQSWIYKIAYNKVIDFYRNKKENTSFEEVEDFLWYNEELSKSIDNKDKLKEIFEYINTLKKEHKEVLIMRFWEDLNYKEISHITSMSENNCKKIVSRNMKIISENYSAFALLLFLIK